MATARSVWNLVAPRRDILWLRREAPGTLWLCLEIGAWRGHGPWCLWLPRSSRQELLGDRPRGVLFHISPMARSTISAGTSTGPAPPGKASAACGPWLLLGGASAQEHVWATGYVGHCAAAFASANWQSARESVDSAGPSAGLRVVATKLHLNNCGLEGRLDNTSDTDCRWKSRPAPPQHRSAASTAGGPRMRPNPQRRLPNLCAGILATARGV